jgi:tight adherence protein C
MSGLMIMLTGLLIAGGLVTVFAPLLPRAPALQPALQRVLGEPGPRLGAVELAPPSRPSERAGAWLFRHSPIPLTAGQRQSLKLQGKSVAEFYADKLVMALIGVALPVGLGFVHLLLTGRGTLWPAALAAAGALLGFFTPDLLLRRSTRASRSSAVEALLVFLDLVTLERLANASATSALHKAAELSDAPLFVQIRIALERARLEQQSPYAELRRLAEQLDLPELNDVADVMQLDETGAALSSTLRARVKELRDAHLTEERLVAGAAAEGMTIYMTLPALIFGLIFLVAALLTLLVGSTG